MELTFGSNHCEAYGTPTSRKPSIDGARSSACPQSPETKVQVDRVALLGRGLKLVEGFRWRIVHRPAFEPRFIINGRGWTYIGHEDRPGRGLWGH